MSLKPAIHGDDHLPGGADPITGLVTTIGNLSVKIAKFDDVGYVSASGVTALDMNFAEGVDGGEGVSITTSGSPITMTVAEGLYYCLLSLYMSSLPVLQFRGRIDATGAVPNILCLNGGGPFVGSVPPGIPFAPFGFDFGGGTDGVIVSLALLFVGQGFTSDITCSTEGTDAGLTLKGGSNLTVIRLGGVSAASM